ncbi:MAG: PLDc N-terminal domain-containing protein [Propionibacteriaceae bacterium]|jgi:bacteriorhodopsin|nr:PLDc N-terminal domain-containing protein [Propionibacteriaceae bacterium]
MTTPNPNPPASNDTGSFGWTVLGFFIPIVGLILWLVWKNDRPKDSTKARNGFIAGLVVSVILGIVYSIIWNTVVAPALGI